MMPAELPGPAPTAAAFRVLRRGGPGPGTAPARDGPDHLAAIIRALEEIARAGPDLDAVADLAARRCRELTGASGGAMALVEGESLAFLAVTGPSAPSSARGIPIQGSFAGLSLRAGEGLACDDVESDPRADRDFYRRIGARSLAVVPLHHAGAAVGVLSVYSPEPGRFDGRDLRTLAHVAGPVGAAVGHAAAFRATQAQLAERTAALEALREGEDRFRAFMDNGPAVAFLKDARGRYVYANAPLRRIVPPGHAGLVGQTDADWLPEAAARVAAASDRMALEGVWPLIDVGLNSRRETTSLLGLDSWAGKTDFPRIRPPAGF